ncbi:MAG: short-chain dehydrogenase [Candidatus Hydrogenedentota bacterium]
MSAGQGKQTYFMTGCASGIGQHVAELLIARGERVYATDVGYDAMAQYAKSRGWPEDRVKLDRLDVRRLEEWEQVFQRAVDEFGAIDVCMNIAGVMLSGWVEEQPANEIDLQIDVNLKGVIWGTQVAARYMVKNRGGHIVNIASLAGIAPIPGISVYVASKHGVRGFSLAVANELKRKGVTLSVVCPDAIKTPLVEQSAQTEAGALVFSGPRLLTLEEIGQVILARAIDRRELEIAVPWKRAWLSKIANMFPNSGARMLPGLIKKGREHQVEHRQKGGAQSAAGQH